MAAGSKWHHVSVGDIIALGLVPGWALGADDEPPRSNGLDAVLPCGERAGGPGADPPPGDWVAPGRLTGACDFSIPGILEAPARCRVRPLHSRRRPGKYRPPPRGYR